MWLVMVGGNTWISFSCRHYFDLSRNPPQRTSAEIRVVQNVQTIITAHSKAWKKNCPIHFPDFNLESFFYWKIYLLWKVWTISVKWWKPSQCGSSTFKADTSTAWISPPNSSSCIPCWRSCCLTCFCIVIIIRKC